MRDDLVKRWDEYVESMGCVMGEVEHMAQQMRDRIEELEAKLGKAVNMLEEAAKVCQRISDTDLAATNPPYEEGYSDAADACFHAIRALIAQEESKL